MSDNPNYATTQLRNAHDPDIKWTKDENGNDVMPPLHREFLNWLCSPLRDPATIEGWASAHNVTARSTRRWRDDPRFRKEWEKTAHETYGGVEMFSDVMRNLYDIATNRKDAAGVKAASLILQAMDRFTPKKSIEMTSNDLSSLSDDDLFKRLEADMSL